MVRLIDMPVHHRRTRPQPPHLVGRGDHFDPFRRRQFALGEDPAHLVVEDLRCRTGNGVQARLTKAVSQSLMLSPLRDAPFTISIGENAWTCIDGTRFLTARTRSRNR